jgi:hypothetical protein
MWVRKKNLVLNLFFMLPRYRWGFMKKTKLLWYKQKPTIFIQLSMRKFVILQHGYIDEDQNEISKVKII